MKKIKKIFIYFLLAPVYFYQIFISPLLGKKCRFTPSCSNYMIEAVKIHGVGYGFYLGIKRILRCHPWGGQGFDPVPPKKVRKNKCINNKKKNKSV